MSTPHVGDIGTVFQITMLDQDGVAADISSATTKQILFEKPDPERTVLIKAADWVTDGTDGKIEYVVVNGDLDLAGTWKIRGKAIAAAWQYSTEKGDFVLES